MNFKEAYKQYPDGGISILVSIGGSLVTVSEVNDSGGCCDCCRYTTIDDEFDNAPVVRVVDIENMEILFEDLTVLEHPDEEE